jgi:hypothetical protein
MQRAEREWSEFSRLYGAKRLKVGLAVADAAASARRWCSYSSVSQVFYGSALIDYQTV